MLAALEALPSYFRPETHIEGINAPDLHTLNSVLGATIEDKTVATLNAMRPIWDPDKKYALYAFMRQSQTFPDVLLRRAPGSGAGVQAKKSTTSRPQTMGEPSGVSRERISWTAILPS